LANHSDSRRESAAPYSQPRVIPRYTFVAVTELTDFATSRKVSGNVQEISRKGCYVETMNVLPVGTSINVRISRDREAFVTDGEVIYAFERRGMGIVFVGTSRDQLEILDLWLAQRALIVAII
jgi:hypothetical protein